MSANLGTSSIFWLISSVDYCTCYFEMVNQLVTIKMSTIGGPLAL